MGPTPPLPHATPGHLVRAEGALDHGRRPPNGGVASGWGVPEDVGGIVIDSLSYFVVQLAPTFLVLGLAWAVVRAIAVSVVWKGDE